MNLDLLALSIHVGLGGAPWDGWTGVHGIPGTPNGRWRSTFGRLGAFCAKHLALRPDPLTDTPDPTPPAKPALCDATLVMRNLWFFPGVKWAPDLELKPYRLEGVAGEPILEAHPCQLLADETVDPDAFRLAQLQTEAARHA
jgi:hypothetical protein